VITLLGTVLVMCVVTVSNPAVGTVAVQGTFTGTVERAQTSTDPPAWSVRVVGPVQIAGLGVGTAVLTYDRVELAPGGRSLQPGSFEGSGVITLSTGDRAFGTLRFLTSRTVDPNVLALVGTIQVTGGTGPFQNVTGSGTAIGRGNVATNQINLSLDGFLEGVSFSGVRNRRPSLAR
jgi:hypothetical protein